jgi:hypothetical protein
MGFVSAPLKFGGETILSDGWRDTRTRRLHGVWSALAFNLCLILAPLAAGAAFFIIARDNLYAYEYSPEGARVIARRVERLNGELIQLDFDRQRQWEDLVAMELNADDLDAARGFLLSIRGMLGPAAAGQVGVGANASDAQLESAALALISPSIRARYQELAPQHALVHGQQDPGAEERQNFLLLTQALLAQPETDTLQLALTGLRLGLAGEMGPRAGVGAAALLDASRRDDYPLGLEAEIDALIGEVVDMPRFREGVAAAATARGGDDFDAAARAFANAADSDAAGRAKAVLDQIGTMSESSSHAGAVYLLTHASDLRDLPKLSLVSQAAGDRVATAAKRLPRDGSLLAAARGELTMTRELAATIAVAILALAGLLTLAGYKTYQLLRRSLHRWREEDYRGDLVELGGR